ncbi:hypothetical protein [Bacillus sp. M6-12]|uniref:hypothetical protein n=1 Tax=Bacillus sp. M6-12 TaxID=2054166 RepID=UPI0015E08275|nr:hypothetical protein [Bacillus sp. M6-12]
MILKVGIILLVYLFFKAGCVIVNESEDIKFKVPKLLERVSLGIMAFASQVVFF